MPVIIGTQISGDVLHNPGLATPMAMGMVVIMAISITLRSCSAGPARCVRSPMARRDEDDDDPARARPVAWWARSS